MSRFFPSFFKGKKRNDSSDGTKEVGFQKALTAGAKTTLLVNGTNQTLYLRDKVGAAYGETRYKIPGNSSIEVTPLQHTFFKMLAYAVEKDNDEKEAAGSSETAGSEGTKKKKPSTDTNLSIDTDQLADNSQIKITYNGLKYELHCTAR